MNWLRWFKESAFSRQSAGYLAIILAGLIWGLGQFPWMFWIRFFGLIPFIYIVLRRKNYLLDTLIFGFSAYLVNFYWLLITFHISGKMPVPLALVIYGILCLYYGLQYPLIAWIYHKFAAYHKPVFFYSLPFIWVAVDYLFPKLFRHTIGDSQLFFYPLIQMIDITGMGGVILIFVLFNLGCYRLLENGILSYPVKFRHFLFVVPLVLSLLYGTLRILELNHDTKTLPKVTAAMVQGGAEGQQKSDRSFFEMNVKSYNRLTRQAIADASVDLVIWPENVFNRSYNGRPETLESIVEDSYPPLLLGLVVWEFQRISNSALLVENRRITTQYDKHKLLIFGEYVPFEKTFPFLRKLTPLQVNGTFGTTSSIIKTGKIKAAVSICFEDLFPDEIRRKNNEGSNIMVNLTNDYWFGNGLGPDHHSIIARLRAIENRRAFFRTTATGLTTASDLTGRVVVKAAKGVKIAVKATLPLYEKKSVYSMIGDLTTHLCIILLIVISLWMIRRHFEKKEIKRLHDKKYGFHYKIDS